MRGWLSGRARLEMGVGLFADEEGYTTVAVATALLVSLSLVFCVASVQWTLSKSADIQEVADASALAGSNAISSFYTIAQVTDACVLSMGLAGFAVMGSGLVAAAIPGAQSVSDELLDKGAKLLDARNKFARSAAKGLRSLEGFLPSIVAAKSWSCAKANSLGGEEYAGVAIPLPLESLSDYSALFEDVEASGVPDVAKRLQDATRESEDAKRRADESRMRAWTADCVDAPRCMMSRARDLAGLAGAQNPYVPFPESWTFGVAIQRTRAYYGARLERESPLSGDIEEVTNSVCREAFYRYALDEVNAAWYMEGEDGSVDLSVPHLARNASEMRGTWLYDEVRWPCTDENGQIVLHSALSCPGALGAHVGAQSVAAIERGEVLRCGTCGMDVTDLGSVASISTSASNGYEHYWQIVVEEAQIYKQARNEQAGAERRAKQIANEGKGTFKRALDQLSAPRPHVCPPGAWGCVSVVYRKDGAVVPSELTKAFLGEMDLGAGVAVSASALAVDNTANDGGVLAHFFDAVSGSDSFGMGALLGGITGLWGRLLVAYGSAYEDVAGAARDYLNKMDGVFGGTLGSWLRSEVASIMGSLGLAPADLRMRKPVLAHTSEVLGKAGIEQSGKVRNLIQSIPPGGSAEDIARALGVPLLGNGIGSVTIAELPIPGTDTSIPLTVDLSRLGG